MFVFAHGNSSLCHGLQDQNIYPFQSALQGLRLVPPKKCHMLSGYIKIQFDRWHTACVY